MPGDSGSRTAQGVVVERVVLTGLGVIDDPLAASMLGPGLRLLSAVLRRLPPVVWRRSITLAGLGARVGWMDAHIRSAVDGGIDQVVVVGAGFDSRAWRMRHDDVRWFELDRPGAQRAKRSVAPGPGPVFVEADLRSQQAAPALVAGGLDLSRPAVFVLEGVSMYLPEETVRDQLESLATSCAVGSRLLADFIPPAGSGSAGNQRQLWLQRIARSGSGERFHFTPTPADARSLVESTGWTVEELTSLRDAACALVHPRARLPVDRVNPDKTLLVAHVT